MIKVRKVRFCLLNSVISLVLGAIIYVFLRSGTYIHDFLNQFISIRTMPIQDTSFTVFLKCYFVDALWAYALTFSLAIFIDEKSCFIVSFLTGIVWEFFQLFAIVNGTFDCIDIIMYLAATLIAVLIIFYSKRGEEHEKQNS